MVKASHPDVVATEDPAAKLAGQFIRYVEWYLYTFSFYDHQLAINFETRNLYS